MEIDVGCFYFIKDSFFDIIDDPELMKNKENGNKRPCYYCFKSEKYDDIIWFVPVSIKVEKYQKIYNKKIEKQIKLGKNPSIDTIVFGNIAAEMKDELMKWVDGKKVIYAGWINPDESYSYFAAADLVVFPGRHSVFWEQVAGQGIPLICKRWPKTEHVNIGGNAMFISDDSMKEIKDIITSLVNNAQMYASMKKAAVDVAMKEFSYENIARKDIDSNR